MAPHSEQVGQRTRRGISWNLAGAALTNGMRILVIAVLGRALDAHAFGVVATAISVNVILYSIRDVGLGPALVQRRDLTAAHVGTAAAVSTYLGLAFSALLAGAAPVIADLYGIPEATPVIRALGLLFALRGVSAVPRMLCQRDMNFRAVALIDALAFTLGSAASMALALAGAGPWALVGGYLLEEASSTGAYLRVAPAFGLRVEGARLRELMSFGAGQTVSQVAGILATYGDNFVVGHALGARALGAYTRAYDLIKFPSTVFAAVVGNVLFPAFSRLQDDRATLALNFRRVLFVNALVLLPASAALYVLAPETIRLLMGPGWDAATGPFRVLTFTILLRTTQKLGAIVATAAGQVNAVAWAYVVYMVLVIGGASITIRWGIAGVAATTALAIAVVAAECCLLAMRASGLGLGAVVAAHLPGLALAGLAGAVAWPLAGALRHAGVPAALRFAIVAGAAALACGAAVLAALRRGGPDLAWLAGELGRLVRRRRASPPPA